VLCVSKETDDVHYGRNIALECSGTGCWRRLQYNSRGVEKNCIMKRFIFICTPRQVLFQWWNSGSERNEVRVGKRRNAYVSVSGKYEEWRLFGRLGVVDGIEINWFLRKREVWNGIDKSISVAAKIGRLLWRR